MANTFDTEYSKTPWAASLDKNQRTVYVPDLMESYARQSMFYQMVDYAVDLGAMRTGEVVFTQRMHSPANIATLDNRALWLPQLFTDSRQIKITALRYGDKIQLHKYDDRITYWRENGAEGLRAIMRGDLAPHMVESLDLLARNAFLSSPFVTFAGGATGFANLATDDTFDVGTLTRGVQLGAEFDPDIINNPIFCITSPSAIHTIRSGASTSEWVDRMKYANPSILVNWEVGAYESVRFVKSPLMTLWNCGAVEHQTEIKASITIGDGAPDPATTTVDGVWETGQAGATHYITVAANTGFAVGDIVTLHTVRNATEDSTHTLDGVQWDHAKNMNCRIVAISSTHISFAEPILTEWYQTDLGGTVYGYMTKARPIHAAIFVKGPRAVVCGVIAPPQTYTPAPVDDTESIWRFSWDAYLKYQRFMTNRFEVHFYAGPVSINNAVVNI